MVLSYRYQINIISALLLMYGPLLSTERARIQDSFVATAEILIVLKRLNYDMLRRAAPTLKCVLYSPDLISNKLPGGKSEPFTTALCSGPTMVE